MDSLWELTIDHQSLIIISLKSSLITYRHITELSVRCLKSFSYKYNELDDLKP